jgi:hypothetical protein
MTTANNALLYNACFDGYMAGVFSGRSHVVAGTFPNLVADAQAFAAAVDALIPTDTAGSPQPAGTTGISVITTGVAIAPTTGTIQEAQLGKTALMFGLAYGTAVDRDYVEGNVTQAATVLVSAYLAGAAALTTP